jgi:hypothetical protein
VWSFPTLEPVVVEQGSFLIERLLDRRGHVEIGVGDPVTPESVIARAESVDKSVTLYVASELGVPNDKIGRHLTKAVGSTFEAGEDIVRRRSGLRTAAVPAPFPGVLRRIDEVNGTVEFVISDAPDELRALVNGEVERIIPDRGAVIIATGSRVFGIVGFGGEAVGRLVVGPDRPDRELTPDQVRDTWRGAIVVAGMTVSVPTLKKLRQHGVAGIVVGSVAEADIRRFITNEAGAGELGAANFWQVSNAASDFAAPGATTPFVIVVTEGFGRIPMADTVYSFLRAHDGQMASLIAATYVGDRLTRPEIYLTAGTQGTGGRVSDELVAGRTVRFIGGKELVSVGTLTSDEVTVASLDGVRVAAVRVKRPNGAEDLVAAANIEVLV